MPNARLERRMDRIVIAFWVPQYTMIANLGGIGEDDDAPSIFCNRRQCGHYLLLLPDAGSRRRRCACRAPCEVRDRQAMCRASPRRLPRQIFVLFDLRGLWALRRRGLL